MLLSIHSHLFLYWAGLGLHVLFYLNQCLIGRPRNIWFFPPFTLSNTCTYTFSQIFRTLPCSQVYRKPTLKFLNELSLHCYLQDIWGCRGKKSPASISVFFNGLKEAPSLSNSHAARRNGIIKSKALKKITQNNKKWVLTSSFLSCDIFKPQFRDLPTVEHSGFLFKYSPEQQAMCLF